jgi:energy-coupling factor transporter ATP-binding protein EcfA2
MLSGGERLKVALGSLLLLEPEVLILDETLTSLDPVARQQTLDLLRQLVAEGLTVVTVTHRPAPMIPLARCLAWMEPGKLQLYEARNVPSRWLPDLARLSEMTLGQRLFSSEDVYRGVLSRLYLS